MAVHQLPLLLWCHLQSVRPSHAKPPHSLPARMRQHRLLLPRPLPLLRALSLSLARAPTASAGCAHLAPRPADHSIHSPRHHEDGNSPPHHAALPFSQATGDMHQPWYRPGLSAYGAAHKILQRNPHQQCMGHGGRCSAAMPGRSRAAGAWSAPAAPPPQRPGGRRRACRRRSRATRAPPAGAAAWASPASPLPAPRPGTLSDTKPDQSTPFLACTTGSGQLGSRWVLALESVPAEG